MTQSKNLPAWVYEVAKDEPILADRSDAQIASDVRMLMRDDLLHEAVCCAGRNRICRLLVRNEALVGALREAVQLAEIAIDWNLDEVEIDGQMVNTRDLRGEFEAAIRLAAPAEGDAT